METESRTHRIKRYGNRRLYDATLSRYVTLEEVAGIIRSGDEIVVVDAKSGEDLTKQILVQILLSDDHGPASLLPSSFLVLLIRYCNESFGEFFQKYLPMSLEFYMRTQREASARMREMFDMLSGRSTGLGGAYGSGMQSPFGVPLGQNPFATYASMFSQGTGTGGDAGTKEAAEPASTRSGYKDEIEGLKEQIRSLEESLRRMEDNAS
ncbi:polyhydroxyalkanoate synthesis regulator DNA-binding domain-containing protein [Planctomycetota bacterium]